MYIEGEIRKMSVHLNDEDIVEYKMIFFDSVTQEEKSIPLNEHIGKKISLAFSGEIYCKKCGNKTKTSYNQGLDRKSTRLNSSHVRISYAVFCLKKKKKKKKKK